MTSRGNNPGREFGASPSSLLRVAALIAVFSACFYYANL